MSARTPPSPSSNGRPAAEGEAAAPAAAPGDLTILISAAGRRPYLLRWFQEALALNGATGRVLLADADPQCAARSSADGFVASPPHTDPGYEAWLRDLLDSHDVSLALSVHDFELSTWATMPDPPAQLLALGADEQALVEDKWALARAGARAGFRVPRTWLGSDVLPADRRSRPVDAFVVKSRFGSGSVGLRFADRRGLASAVAAASREVLDRTGRRVEDHREALEHVIVQERIEGIEFGLDVVNDLDGRYAGCFARSKLRMRHGETDAAETVDAAPFAEGASALAAVTRHQGLIDADVILDEDERAWLIDVNPRFGGGYPFSHLAGANAPAAMVAWALGRDPEPGWLEPRAGVVSAKSVGVVRVHDPADAEEDAAASGRHQRLRSGSA